MEHPENRERPARILVLDDEPVVSDVLRRLLGREGYQVEVALNAAAGRDVLDEETPLDALLLDVMLPDADGLEVLRWVRKRRPDLAVVMITAFGSVENAVAAMKLGAFHYLTKPFKNDEVRALVARAVQTTRLRLENRDLRQALQHLTSFEKIIGRSRAMQEVFQFIEQVAASLSTVLIYGESGTGKDLVARAIHRRSLRADKPFVVVSSQNIPADLLDANLFGHTRGAFTGASTAKRGLVEVADGGTILFDEISIVPPEVQAKLLRVIQEKEFLPLGSVESRTVDVRILAATNENLKQLVEQGRFREDLYYRLNVIAVTLPPLRKRAGDVPLLAEHFLRRFSAENKKDVRRFSPEVMERLLAYSWPGNVRELENVVQRGVVLAQGEEIGTDVLPEELSQQISLPETASLPEGVGFNEAVARYERRLIRAALRRSGGVQKRAAEILGLKPTTLHEKLKRLGIQP